MRKNKLDLENYSQYINRKWVVLFVLAIGLMVVSLLSLLAGSANMSIKDVILALFGKSSRQMNTIIRNVRLPRLVSALVVGASLSLSGCIMQNVLRNPLASSSTLGVSQGASFGAALAIICLDAGSQINTGSASSAALTITNPYMVSVCAFLGGMLTTVVILALSKLRDSTPSVMVLAGVAISSMFTGGTTLLQYFADDVMVSTIVYWTFGNLGRAGWREIAIIALLSFTAFVFFVSNRWNYNALESGHDSAKSLGVNTSLLVPFSLAFCALISSVSVAFTGCISFIGLIAPHIMRRFVGNDYRFLIPTSALCGALLLLLADIACRMIVAPIVLPIGALTSFMGAPLFLYLIMRQRRAR